MNKEFVFVCSLSILLPLIAGIIRFKKISESYYPLLVLLAIGLANELICYFLFSDKSNAIPTNIYYLIEALMLVWQFRSWRNVLKDKRVYQSLQTALVIAWVIDKIVLKNLHQFTLYFTVLSSLIIVLLSVNQLNWLITNDRKKLIRNPIFIICNAIVFYFSYQVMAEVFYYFAPEQTLKKDIFGILVYVNLAYNIFLFIAILCIPPKRTFLKPLL